MSKNLNEVLRFLPHLSQQDLATARGAIEHLLAKKVEDDPTLPLFSTVISLLGVRISFHAFRSTQAYKSWKRTAPAYLQFVDQTWPEASKVAKGAITAVLLDMLIDDLAGMGVTPTMSSVATGLERIPQLVDRAFPGYRKSGMTHLILEAMEKEGGK